MSGPLGMPSRGEVASVRQFAHDQNAAAEDLVVSELLSNEIVEAAAGVLSGLPPLVQGEARGNPGRVMNAGCCTTCDGSGGDVTSPETNGRCVDCMGTGHCHDAATACNADWDDSFDGIQARNRAIEAFISQAWESPAAEASALIEHALAMEHAARVDVPALLAAVDRAYKDGYRTGKSHAAAPANSKASL